MYAFRQDADRHKEFRGWLNRCRAGAEPFSAPGIVMSGFLRVVTNPRIYPDPDPLAEALAFLNALRRSGRFVATNPGPQHWSIFVELCRKAGACGNLVADAYLAAFAMEAGGVWITADRDFARFPGLKWRHPLD